MGLGCIPTRRFPLFAVPILLLACVTTRVSNPYDVSAPTGIPGGVLGRIDSDGLTTIYMEGLELRIQVPNRRAYDRQWSLGIWPYAFPFIVPAYEEATPTETKEPSPLVLLLRFDTRDDGILFHPDSVRVSPSVGPAQSMEAFKGPNCAGEWSPSESSRNFELTPGQTCFLLRFALQSSPDVPFGFHFSGLSRRGRPTPSFDLRFSKFKGSSEE